MPEYLAPGVYVEETSFRSKSIEGVSTSTTAFVGLARKGPVTDHEEKSETPEILTSYVDFERVFGGFEDVQVGGAAVPNYLAHAVNAFFGNGGSRLYVARVASPDAVRAASPLFAGGQAQIRARFPGRAGNGRILLSLGFAPIQKGTWNNLPAGTVVRVGGGTSPLPARLRGKLLKRFAVEDGATLTLTINGVAAPAVTFAGKRASLPAVAAAQVNIAPGDVLTVEVNGEPQTVSLTPDPARSIKDIFTEINGALRGVSVALDEGTSTLTIETDTAGTASSLRVTAAPAGLGFGALPAVATSAPDPVTNNVKDLRAIDLDDLKALLKPLVAPDLPNQPTLQISARVAPDGTRALDLATVKTGATPAPGASLTAAGTALAGLGLDVAPDAAADGSQMTFFVKAAGQAWDDAWTGDGIKRFAVSLAITAVDADGHARLYDDLGLDSSHGRFAGKVLPEKPARKAEHLENLFHLHTNGAVDGKTWAEELVQKTAPFSEIAGVPDSDERIERELPAFGASAPALTGTDGTAATAADYRKAFAVLERLDDVSIVAAPGYSADAAQADAIEVELLKHAEKRRSYRVAVLDARQGQSIGEVRETKARIDSKYAALYYPWVVVSNPLWRPGDASVRREIEVPPSGFVAGIYARNDVERGVYKAPANEVVRGALRFETDVNFAQQEVLNPLGVNCLRFFPGRGYRVWGGRTASSDPEWKYISVRRYFNYLERSIDIGTQWAVFEPNGERLWANVRETIASFLYNEWRSGALLGAEAKEAFFVRCDRSTMDQNDLDNGRLVCLIGVAVVKPAEFVIFRIGQKTADART